MSLSLPSRQRWLKWWSGCVRDVAHTKDIGRKEGTSLCCWADRVVSGGSSYRNLQIFVSIESADFRRVGGGSWWPFKKKIKRRDEETDGCPLIGIHRLLLHWRTKGSQKKRNVSLLLGLLFFFDFFGCGGFCDGRVACPSFPRTHQESSKLLFCSSLFQEERRKKKRYIFTFSHFAHQKVLSFI